MAIETIRLSGDLNTVSGGTETIAKVGIRSPRVRAAGGGIITETISDVAVTRGTVTFNVAEGPAVMLLYRGNHSHAVAHDAVPLLVKKGMTTLAEAVDAGQLATGATAAAIEAMVARTLDGVNAAKIAASDLVSKARENKASIAAAQRYAEQLDGLRSDIASKQRGMAEQVTEARGHATTAGRHARSAQQAAEAADQSKTQAVASAREAGVSKDQAVAAQVQAGRDAASALSEKRRVEQLAGDATGKAREASEAAQRAQQQAETATRQARAAEQAAQAAADRASQAVREQVVAQAQEKVTAAEEQVRLATAQVQAATQQAEAAQRHATEARQAAEGAAGEAARAAREEVVQAAQGKVEEATQQVQLATAQVEAATEQARQAQHAAERASQAAQQAADTAREQVVRDTQDKVTEAQRHAETARQQAQTATEQAAAAERAAQGAVEAAREQVVQAAQGKVDEAAAKVEEATRQVTAATEQVRLATAQAEAARSAAGEAAQQASQSVQESLAAARRDAENAVSTARQQAVEGVQETGRNQQALLTGQVEAATRQATRAEEAAGRAEEAARGAQVGLEPGSVTEALLDEQVQAKLAAIEGKAASSHRHVSSDITDAVDVINGNRNQGGKLVKILHEGGIHVTHDPVSPNHVTRKQWVERQVAGKANASHRHVTADITDSVDWATGGRSTAGKILRVNNDGHIHVGANPSNEHHVTRKAWVDQQINTRAPLSHTHTVEQVTGLTEALAGKAATEHTHTTAQVEGLDAALAGKAASSHRHVSSDITDAVDVVNGNRDQAGKLVKIYSTGGLHVTYNPTSPNHVTRKEWVEQQVNTRAPQEHTHTTAQVTGLTEALAGKAAAEHTHTIAHITGLQDALDRAGRTGAGVTTSAGITDAVEGVPGNREGGGKLVKTRADGTIHLGFDPSESEHPTRKSWVEGQLARKSERGHRHSVSEVDGLQTALDGKADSRHRHTTGDITGLGQLLDRKADTSHTHTSAQITDSVDWATGGRSTAGKILRVNNDGHIHVGANPSNEHHVTRKAWVDQQINTRAPLSHTHTIEQVQGLRDALNRAERSGGAVASNAVTDAVDVVQGSRAISGKLIKTNRDGYLHLGYDPSSGDHATRKSWVDRQLAGKANTSHSHSTSQITGLDTALRGKAEASHTHTISQITGLENRLAAIERALGGWSFVQGAPPSRPANKTLYIET